MNVYIMLQYGGNGAITGLKSRSGAVTWATPSRSRGLAWWTCANKLSATATCKAAVPIGLQGDVRHRWQSQATPWRSKRHHVCKSCQDGTVYPTIDNSSVLELRYFFQMSFRGAFGATIDDINVLGDMPLSVVMLWSYVHYVVKRLHSFHSFTFWGELIIEFVFSVYIICLICLHELQQKKFWKWGTHNVTVVIIYDLQ
jgi:hypothetical protein